MSDSDHLPDLPHPRPAMSPRDRLEGWAESLDLSLSRLALGVGVLLVLGVAGWRLLAPDPPPPEMTLPLAAASDAAPASAAADVGAADGPGAPAPDGPDEPAGAGAGGEVVVHVAGAVHAPGVQRLPAGARLVDAVGAAGGATDDADLARVNLAAVLDDGLQVYLPAVGEEGPPEMVAAHGQGSGRSGGADGQPASVNVNTAGPEQLESLPGVGPAIAGAIVDHRESRGPFGSVDELIEVRGIGEVKLEALREHATV